VTVEYSIDAATRGRYIETFVVERWAEAAFAFHLGAGPPNVTHWIASE
jgi:hypothetical protein